MENANLGEDKKMTNIKIILIIYIFLNTNKLWRFMNIKQTVKREIVLQFTYSFDMIRIF